MFSRIAATSGKTALLAAGSAIGGASGATYLLSSDEAAVARCESAGGKKPTVLSLLADISSRVSKIEESVGIQQSGGAAASKKYVGQSELARRQTMASAKYGIDIVLGAQWGDEGKGKLVDMLSQVRLWMEKMIKKNLGRAGTTLREMKMILERASTSRMRDTAYASLENNYFLICS